VKNNREDDDAFLPLSLSWGTKSGRQARISSLFMPKDHKEDSKAVW